MALAFFFFGVSLSASLSAAFSVFIVVLDPMAASRA